VLFGGKGGKSSGFVTKFAFSPLLFFFCFFHGCPPFRPYAPFPTEYFSNGRRLFLFFPTDGMSPPFVFPIRESNRAGQGLSFLISWFSPLVALCVERCGPFPTFQGPFGKGIPALSYKNLLPVFLLAL